VPCLRRSGFAQAGETLLQRAGTDTNTLFSIEGLEGLIPEQLKGEGGERHVQQTGEAKVKEVGNVPSVLLFLRLTVLNV
jgi:hypothetical protein